MLSSTIIDGYRFLSLEIGEQVGPFDLVIDASGAQSLIRPMSSKELPFGAIWGAVDWLEKTDLLYNQLEQRYLKARHMIGILPIDSFLGETKRKAALFWSMPKEDYAKWCTTPIEQWWSQAEKLWPELSPFIQQITDHEQMIMARYSHGQLFKPYEEKVVFIVDSAHRASPKLGQGANMALLDTYALALALSCSVKDVEEVPLQTALTKYEKARKNHVMIYQAMSWAFTPMYQSNSRVLAFLRDRIFASFTRVPTVPSILTSLVKGTMVNPYKGFK